MITNQLNKIQMKIESVQNVFRRAIPSPPKERVFEEPKRTASTATHDGINVELFQEERRKELEFSQYKLLVKESKHTLTKV